MGSLWFAWTGNAELFQRAGAMGVAAATLFFSDRLTQIELLRQSRVENLLHELGVEIDALKQGVRHEDKPKTGRTVDYLTEEERNFGKLRQQADVFGFFNVILLTLATMQWGFGDRMVNTMVVCGDVKC